MKKIFFVFSFFSSLSAIAAQSSIYDLQYLSKARKGFGETEISYFNDLNQGKRFKGFNYSQAFGHSFTDRFQLNASIVYQDYNYDIGGVDGLQNPKVGFKYRVFNQDVHRLDVTGDVSINPWGKRYYRNNERRDAHEGGNTLDLGVAYGQKYSTYQWSVGAKFARHFEKKSHYDQTDTTQTAAENNAYGFDFRFLTKLSEKSLIRSALAFDVNEPFKVQKGNYSNTTNFTEFKVEYGYTPLSDLMVFGGITQSTTKQNSEKEVSFIYNLGARYEF